MAPSRYKYTSVKTFCGGNVTVASDVKVLQRKKPMALRKDGTCLLNIFLTFTVFTPHSYETGRNSVRKCYVFLLNSSKPLNPVSIP